MSHLFSGGVRPNEKSYILSLYFLGELEDEFIPGLLLAVYSIK